MGNYISYVITILLSKVCQVRKRVVSRHRAALGSIDFCMGFGPAGSCSDSLAGNPKPRIAQVPQKHLLHHEVEIRVRVRLIGEPEVPPFLIESIKARLHHQAL